MSTQESSASYEQTNIDVTLLESGVATEPQLMPTTDTPSQYSSPSEPSPVELSFVSMDDTSENTPVTGTMQPEHYTSDTTWGSMTVEKTPTQGRMSKYLETKGFGWLMEVEDQEDEDDNKPLL